jgi:hypothetical protein
MKLRNVLVLVVGISLVTALPVRADFTVTQYDSDGNSGISSNFIYSQAIDLAGPGETINGVTFSKDSAPIRTQYNYDVVGTFSSPQSQTTNTTGQIRNMEVQYIYDTNPIEKPSITLRELHVGYIYTTTFYDEGSGAPGQSTMISTSDGTKFTYDENYTGSGNGNELRNTFMATTTQYTYTFDTTGSTPFHFYGFSNQVVSPEPSTLTLAGIGSGVLMGYVWKRRKKVAVQRPSTAPV